MFEPTAVMVAGRGKLIALATPDELGLSIQVDDERRPDWWCAVRLTRQQLADLLGQVNLCQEALSAASEGEVANALGTA